VSDVTSDDDEDEDVSYEEAAEQIHTSFVELLFNVSEAEGSYEAVGPIVSGTIAGLTEFLWRTRKEGVALQEVLDLWTSLGKDFLRQIQDYEEEERSKH
jgi:hypothetical protein